MTANPHIHTQPHEPERGSVLIVALMVLLIVGLLVSATLSLAVSTNQGSRLDSYRKNALEAAEAGLQVALYRLNMLVPDTSHCVGDAVASPGTNGTCASSSYSFGNGSSYQYWTTPALGTSGSCVGMTVVSSSLISQRCVTALGTNNGITERSQIRAAAFGAQPLFPYDGVTGISGITNGNNATINGAEASNETIGGGNSNTTITGGVELGPGGSYTGAGNPPKTTISTIVLGPVNPGTSNQTSLASCPTRQAAGYTTCNDDYRITDGLSSPIVSPYDQASGPVTFTASTRTLTLGNNASLTLGGGLYNFCEIDIKNNDTISLAPGVRAEIFIDSPDDPNSGCPAGSGSLTVENNVTWSNPTDDPTALQIYVYGWDNGQNTVNFMNNGTCYCVLYAPQSVINLSHDSSNSDLTGAVSGAHVNAPNNFNFNWDSRAGTLQATSTGLYYRTAWAQCTPTYSSSTPGSGCG